MNRTALTALLAKHGQKFTDDDILLALVALPNVCPNFRTLTNDRQHVLIAMEIELGYERLLRFSKLRSCVAALDFVGAAKEMRESAWAQEAGDRASELAAMMEGVS